MVSEGTHCVTLLLFRVRASRCIWANRSPGKVRNAPIREQSRARASLKVSLDMGPLHRKTESKDWSQKGYTHRHAHTDTHACRQTDTETDTETGRPAEKGRPADSERQTQEDKHRHTHAQTDTRTHAQTDTHIYSLGLQALGRQKLNSTFRKISKTCKQGKCMKLILQGK